MNLHSTLGFSLSFYLYVKGARHGHKSACDGGINAMVEGSKFKESHVLENTKLWNKVGRMPRPLVLFRLSNSGLASFCACFQYPVLGRLCPYASRRTACWFGLVKACKLSIYHIG